MNITPRDRERLMAQSRAYRASKMQRDHEIELLLNANIPLAEAIAIVDSKVPA